VINHPALAPYAERYATLDMVPLCVTAELLNPLGGYDFPHLDNLLAWAVVEEATRGAGLPPSAEPYDLPLPLRCLWRDPESDLPLWASTDLLPAGGGARDVSYWHKRAVTPAMIRRNVRTTQGRHKERRTPLPTVAALTWRAEAIGDAREVARLLAFLGPHIGKKRGQGLGAVARWRVEVAQGFALGEAGYLRRPVPLAALDGATTSGASFVGWTPPYWLPAGQGWALPTGAGWTEEAGRALHP
jgi:hypothetical protein